MVDAWCEKLGIDLLASQLQVTTDRVTGRRLRVCDGAEKAKMIQERYELTRYEAIYGYGDSPSDREMLALADHSYFRPFRKNGRPSAGESV
jgi:phosphoserine phosphatase